MREEVAAAVVFITRLVKRNECLSADKIDFFSERLSGILIDRFENHWYQDKPQKGQAYRCIRVNESMSPDPVLEKAAADSGLTYGDLRMPPELTLWVDPHEVCCRFGENKGSWCTVARFKNGLVENRVNSPDLDKVIDKTHQQQKPIEVTRSMNIARHNAVQMMGRNNNPHPVGIRNYNHNHNNNLMKHNKLRQPSCVSTQLPSTSPPFNKQLKYVSSGKPFKATPQFQQRLPSSRNDRYHWVRGADLVKA